jgi:hypothetical protein
MNQMSVPPKRIKQTLLNFITEVTEPVTIVVDLKNPLLSINRTSRPKKSAKTS